MVPVSSACKVCEVSKLVVSTDKFSEKYNYVYINVYNRFLSKSDVHFIFVGERTVCC